MKGLIILLFLKSKLNNIQIRVKMSQVKPNFTRLELDLS